MNVRSHITALYAALFAVLLAVSPAGSGSMTLLGVGKPSGAAGGCSQATAFLARTTGLSGTETSAYTTLICGLVTDGVITGTMAGSGVGASACGSILDLLYITTTKNTSTASLNLCSTSFTATPFGSLTFSADNYWSPDDALSGLDTGFNPNTAGGAFSLNSASMGGCVLNNRTSNANTYAIGVQDTSTVSLLQLLNGGQALFDLNEAAFSQAANTSSIGSWTLTRGNSTSLILYNNATSFASVSAASSSVPNFSIYLMANNNKGSVSGGSTNDQFAAFWVGGNLTSGLVTSLRTRIAAFVLAVKGSSGC